MKDIGENIAKYHKNGKIKSQGFYTADKQTGEWSFYWPDGKLESRRSYNKQGQKHSPWIETKLNYGIRSPKTFTVIFILIYTNGKLTDKKQKDAVLLELQRRNTHR